MAETEQLVSKSEDDFTDKTIQIWSRYYNRDISSNEAEEIKQNIEKLIELLKTLNKN